MTMFSVVVVTYNSSCTLELCLDSVLRTLGSEDEVLLIDNASRDRTLDIARRFAGEDPRLVVIPSAENLGFSAGTNLGLRKARGDSLVLLNPDTVVTTGWLARMAAHFARGTVGRVGAVGPVSDFAAHKQHVTEYLSTAGMDYEAIAAALARAGKRPGIRTRLLIGFCMMLPRKVLDEVGLLDPELFLGCDDLDLSWRLALAGYELVIATDVFIHHDGQVSYNTQPSEIRTSLGQRSFDALGRKLERFYGRGQVPSPEALWDVDFFTPLWDLWGPRPTTFRLPDGLPADEFARNLEAYLAAFGPDDPVMLEVAVEASSPGDDRETRILAEGDRVERWLREHGFDPERIPDIAVGEPDPATPALTLAGDPPIAAILRQAAGFPSEPAQAGVVSVALDVGSDAAMAAASLKSLLLHTQEPLDIRLFTGDTRVASALGGKMGNLDVRLTNGPEALALAWREFARQATGEYVVFATAAALFTPGWLSRLVRPLLGGNGIALTAPRTSAGPPWQRLDTCPPGIPWRVRDFGRERARDFAGQGFAATGAACVLLTRRSVARRLPAAWDGRESLDQVLCRLAREDGDVWIAQDVYLHTEEPLADAWMLRA